MVLNTQMPLCPLCFFCFRFCFIKYCRWFSLCLFYCVWNFIHDLLTTIIFLLTLDGWMLVIKTQQGVGGWNCVLSSASKASADINVTAILFTRHFFWYPRRNRGEICLQLWKLQSEGGLCYRARGCFHVSVRKGGSQCWHDCLCKWPWKAGSGFVIVWQRHRPFSENIV